MHRTIVLGSSFVVSLALTWTAQAQSWVSASPSATPTRFVGKTYAFYLDGKIGAGSGVLVGKRHVLTAGHNLFRKEQKWKGLPQSTWKPVTVMFTPGLSGGSAPFGSANATQWAISNGIFQGNQKSRDFGVVRLNQDLSKKTGGFAAYGKWNDGWQYSGTLYGYPGNAVWPLKISFAAKNHVAAWEAKYDWHLWWSTTNIGGKGGCSGGPLFIGSVVRGIYQAQKNKLSGPYLAGFRISDIPYNEIKNWISSHP